MRKDAEANAEEDRKHKEKIDAKNSADSLVYQTEKALKDFEGKGDSSEVAAIKKAVEELKAVADSDDLNGIKAKSEEVTKVLYPFIEKMYKQQAAETPQAQPDENQGMKDDNVVDAEYTEVDKDKDK